LLLGQRPPAEPVVGDTEHLAEVGGVGMRIPIRPQDSERLLLVPPLQGPGPPQEGLLEAPAVAHRLRPLGRRHPGCALPDVALPRRPAAFASRSPEGTETGLALLPPRTVAGTPVPGRRAVPVPARPLPPCLAGATVLRRRPPSPAGGAPRPPSPAGGAPRRAGMSAATGPATAEAAVPAGIARPAASRRAVGALGSLLRVSGFRPAVVHRFLLP